MAGIDGPSEGIPCALACFSSSNVINSFLLTLSYFTSPSLTANAELCIHQHDPLYISPFQMVSDFVFVASDFQTC